MRPDTSGLSECDSAELGGHVDLAFGSSNEAEAWAIRQHFERCPACRALLASDEEIRQRLALLREGEPRIDVLAQVMRQIDADHLDLD